MYQNNGRVADVTNASTLDYPLHTQACIKTDLKDSIKTLHESNTLSKVLFSAKNIEIIQSNIRHQVYLLSEKKYIIDINFYYLGKVSNSAPIFTSRVIEREFFMFDSNRVFS